MDFELCDKPNESTGVYHQSTGVDRYIKLPTYGTRRHFLPICRKWVDQVRVYDYGGLFWMTTRYIKVKDQINV
jgi:hypothetical protein